ncbi:MAG TPA: energy transducer TonB [Flavisolibacter sp.]
MKGSKTYSANDIERYHSGQLSAAEMHALELAALDDPFLADALEGYTHSKKPSVDIALLQQRLADRIEEKSKRRSLFMSSSWMKIAALFIVFAGSGLVVFRMLSDKNEPALAVSRKASEKQEPVVATETVADSTSFGVSVPGTEVTMNKAAVENETTEALTPSTNDPVIVGYGARQQQLDKTTSFRSAMRDSLKDQGTIAGITTFRQSSPADSTAYNTMAEVRSLAPAKPAALPDTIKNINIVMKRSDLPAPEVVVINKNKGSERKELMGRMRVKVDTLEPAEGWTNFDDYIANNLKQPEELKTKPVRGEVELSFEVNQQGEPVNITVAKSLCEKCDEEAIRLLKEGPKWNKKKKKGKVKIKF